MKGAVGSERGKHSSSPVSFLNIAFTGIENEHEAEDGGQRRKISACLVLLAREDCLLRGGRLVWAQ
jgi:hypothetical protein